MRTPSAELLCTQNAWVTEGTVLNNVSKLMVSSENVSLLPTAVENESLFVHAVSRAAIMSVKKKSRLIIRKIKRLFLRFIVQKEPVRLKSADKLACLEVCRQVHPA